MARGVTTLENMVQNLRFETRRSSNTNIGQDEYTALVHLIQRMQLWLYWDFEWPFLKVRRDIILQEEQRYYDMPVDLDFERIERIRGNGNNFWEPISRGIDMELYNIHDSDNNEKSFPATHWDIIDATGTEQVEVWPLPSQDGEIFRFEGFRKLNPLVSDNDTCTLDDTLIVMFAAARLLAGQDDALAKTTLNEANKLYLRMRGGANRREGAAFVMGGEMSRSSPHNSPAVIAVRGT